MKAKVVLAAVKGERTEAEKAPGYYVAAIALTENADPVRPLIAPEPIHHSPLREVAS